MQKFMLSCFFSVISIAIASTTSVTSVNAQTTGTSVNSTTTAKFLDNTTPQIIEKISGNIVTFKDAAGESNNYYVPNWMFEKYDLKVGTSANLYNRNVIQGIYRDRYIDIVSQGLPDNMSAFAIHETERHCINPASQGLGSGMRVWYRAGDCPSAIPVVGAMSFYRTQPIAFSESSERRSNTTSDTGVTPATDVTPATGVTPATDASKQEMMRNDALRNGTPPTMDTPTTPTTPTDASRQEMMRQEMMRNDALRNGTPPTMDTPTTPTDASRQEMMRQEMMRNDALRNGTPRTMDTPTTVPNMNR